MKSLDQQGSRDLIEDFSEVMIRILFHILKYFQNIWHHCLLVHKPILLIAAGGQPRLDILKQAMLRSALVVKASNFIINNKFLNFFTQNGFLGEVTVIYNSNNSIIQYTNSNVFQRLPMNSSWITQVL